MSWIEKNNHWVEQKEKNSESLNNSLLSQSQKDFVKHRLDDDITFFDWNIDSKELYDNYVSFLSSKDAYKELNIELSGIKKSKIEILKSQLKSEVLKITIPRKSNLQKLTTKYSSEYNLSQESLDELKNLLSKTGNESLSSMLRFPNKRLDFLLQKKIFSNKNEALASKKKIESFMSNKIRVNLGVLNQEQKTYLFNIFNSSSKMDIEGLDILLEAFEWYPDSKRALVKYFLESVSYHDLEKNNILNKHLEKKIFDNFKKESENLFIWLEDKEIKEIFDSLDKKTYFINLNNLQEQEPIENLLDSQKIKSRLVDIYNSEIDQSNSMQESILWDLEVVWEEQNIHESFLQMVSKDQKIMASIKDNINKLVEWNMIELEYYDKKWKSNYTYYHISKVDHWAVAESKKLKLKNVTTPNGFSKNLDWNEENYLYDDFYTLLVNLSKPEFKDATINFYEKEELKDKEMVEDNNIYEIQDLKNKIDALDSEWKEIDFKSDKMVISSNDDDNFIFLIDSIDEANYEIKINQWSLWSISVSFNQFYDVFKNANLKRNKKINNFDELIQVAWEKWLDWFNSLELWWKNEDKIVLKSDKDEAKEEWYEWVRYFVGDGKEAIYIKKISKDSIEYVTWTFEEWKEWDSWSFKTDEAISYTAKNFSQFFYDIEKNGMSPYTKHIKEEKKSKEEIEWENSLRWSALSRYMSRMSFADMMWAIKFFPDNIKKSLERWSKLKSLKFAQSMAKIWPDSFYLNMKSAAEQEEKSLTEEISNNLKSLWSKDMIKQVEKILLNKDSEEYEVVAAMMTIVGKYWNLYPKALKKYSWSLLWYKRLWWTQAKLRDFKDGIANAKSPDWKPQPVFFTEERLVESWLWDRAKKWTIRSRLDKDFGWALANGMKEEMDDWAMKSGNKITTEWRISYFLWELKNLWYANAIWSLENIFWKNGSSFEMNAVPFVLTASWYSKNMDQVLLNKLIWLGFSTPYTSLVFNKDLDWINLYNSFIEKLIEDKLDSWALKAFQGARDQSNPEKKVNWLYDFWKKYWKDLIDHINLSDPYVVMKKDSEPIYKQYYEMLNWVHSDWEFNMKDDDIIYWVYEKNPIAYTKWGISKISSDPTWGLWRQTSKDTYYMYINSIKKLRDYKIEDVAKSEKEKIELQNQRKKLFKEQFEFFADSIKEVAWRYSKTEWSWNPIIDVMVDELWFGLYDKDKYINKEDYLEKAYTAFMNKWRDLPGEAEEETKKKISDLID